MVPLLAALLQSASPPPSVPSIREEQLCPGGRQVSAAELCPTLIFFDSGKFELSREAQAALDEVAERLRSSPGKTVRLTGHSDREGSAAANRAVALRRAQRVADELRSRGVRSMAITTAGEDRPLITTVDGVREPQNRRVEIIVQHR